ncbi:putative phenylalanine--tRNA ligase [Helianthus debilis subsp. tardiflorus]
MSEASCGIEMAKVQSCRCSLGYAEFDVPCDHFESLSEVVRSSLMAGILETATHNKDHPKPIKIFQVGDVTVFDELKDVGATNHRQLVALYCGSLLSSFILFL